MNQGRLPFQQKDRSGAADDIHDGDTKGIDAMGDVDVKLCR
jgi:hypothetical protein